MTAVKPHFINCECHICGEKIEQHRSVAFPDHEGEFEAYWDHRERLMHPVRPDPVIPQGRSETINAKAHTAIGGYLATMPGRAPPNPSRSSIQASERHRRPEKPKSEWDLCLEMAMLELDELDRACGLDPEEIRAARKPRRDLTWIMLIVGLLIILFSTLAYVSPTLALFGVTMAGLPAFLRRDHVPSYHNGGPR